MCRRLVAKQAHQKLRAEYRVLSFAGKKVARERSAATTTILKNKWVDRHRVSMMSHMIYQGVTYPTVTTPDVRY